MGATAQNSKSWRWMATANARLRNPALLPIGQGGLGLPVLLGKTWDYNVVVRDDTQETEGRCGAEKPAMVEAKVDWGSLSAGGFDPESGSG